MSVSLPADLLHILLDSLEQDGKFINTLYRCLFVNKQFHTIALRALYSNVDLRPTYGNTSATFDRLSAASLPQNASHVLVLRIGGYFPPDTPVPSSVLTAVKAFSNLHTVEVMPDVYPDDFFSEALEQLVNRIPLTTLRVNGCCMSDTGAALLTHIGGLERLELQSPTRAVLNLLPGWLSQLSSLSELHLTANCGSVTPGFLRSLIPLVKNISAISLGLSYSITDDDLFDFLGQLPCLERAQLQHYVQFKVASSDLPLARLRSLTVLHKSTEEREEIERLCAWVCCAISSAPIECLQLCCDGEHDESAFAPRSFDVLLEDLAHSNALTLRILNIGGWLVSANAISLLFQACSSLEEFAAAIDQPGLLEFERLVPSMRHLHTAALQVYAVGVIVSLEDATRIMASSRALRRLSIDDLKTEASWVSEGGDVRFVVSECEPVPIKEQTQTPPLNALDSESDVSEEYERSFAMGMGAIQEEDEPED